jgi:glycosyltransferase involved in cell wall biosynthesis
VDQVAATRRGDLLVVTAGVIPPCSLLDRALELMSEDPRVGTVSFFSNDAGLLSFPNRNEPAMLGPGAPDQDSITARLRELSPVPGFVDIPFAIGPVVLVSTSVLTTCGPLEDGPSGSLRTALADLSLRSRIHGFRHLLDCGTYVSNPSDRAAHARTADPSQRHPLSGLGELDEQWLFTRHPVASAHLRSVAEDAEPAFGSSFNAARVKVLGLKVLIDGRSLKDPQMGTQTATLYQAQALSRHPEVREVVLAVSAELPDYARNVVAGDQVRVLNIGDGDLGSCGKFEIGYRPHVPLGPYRPAEWRGVADRHLVNMLDLIAYDIGDYFPSAESWQVYRDHVIGSVQRADGVIVISADVADAVQQAALPVDSSRLFLVPLGTDHMNEYVLTTPPEALIDAGYEGKPFLVCLGTDYACRNRDVALGAWRELRARGYDVGLVFAGVSVQWGNSRAAEARQQGDEAPLDLGSVPEAERNWLLKHAALILCPSSADGFGFVPFEAALAGTPSLSVSYGPFRELGGQTPVWAATWSAGAFADAAQALLDDPKLGDRQAAARRAVAADLTWEKTAGHLVRAFRDVLSRPPSAKDEPWPAAPTPDELIAERDELRGQLRLAESREPANVARRLAARFRRT